MLTDEYIKRVYDQVVARDGDQPEFLQAVREVFETLQPVVEKHPEYEKAGVLERIVEPERTIKFRVAWVDDEGKVQVNRGYRIQFNSAIGPYKGGLRFHPTVTESVVKFLGFEQILKNSLTTLPMGGINVGGREIGYLFGQYKRIRDEYSGVLTGKGLEFGGSLARTEATGYGVCYYTQEALRVLRNDSFEGKTVVISGSGNVATYAAQKAEQLGAKVVTVSDSNGYIYDPNGINVEVVKQIKEVERGRIKEYAERVPGSEYHEGSKGVWTVKGDIALPCATQNEVDGESAQKLVDNGVTVVVEGANMPSTPEAIEVYQKNGVLYGPAKAANAGGVAVSGLEMSQNSYRLSWTFEEVDAKLKSIMEEIVANSLAAAKEYGHEGDLMLGANAAGFVKVANAMVAQGVL